MGNTLSDTPTPSECPSSARMQGSSLAIAKPITYRPAQFPSAPSTTRWMSCLAATDGVNPPSAKTALKAIIPARCFHCVRPRRMVKAKSRATLFSRSGVPPSPLLRRRPPSRPPFVVVVDEILRAIIRWPTGGVVKRPFRMYLRTVLGIRLRGRRITSPSHQAANIAHTPTPHGASAHTAAINADRSS